MISPFYPHDTLFNFSIAYVLTSTLSFKDLYWLVNRVFLPFKHDEAQCLEVPWFPLTMAIFSWVRGFQDQVSCVDDGVDLMNERFSYYDVVG
jgi:hypothetical protein